MSGAYMNPSVDANSYGSPMEQAIRDNQRQQNVDAENLYASTGNPLSGGGRTLNVPKHLPQNVVPGPSYNGAVTTGIPCQGGHCSIPVTPQVDYLINKNLSNGTLPPPPPLAKYNYPGTHRLGNNYFKMPGIGNYVGTEQNPGPFEMNVIQGGGSLYQYITHPRTKKMYNINSHKGKHILQKYISLLR